MKRWIVAVSLTVVAAAQTELKLPDGAGRKQFQDICSKCHELDGIVALHNTKQAWTHVVDQMVERGAEGSDEDFELIVEYLTKNFGRDKVKVNQAPAKDLAAALAIPQDVAEAIVAEREKNGAFKDWDDLKRVSALDLKKLEEKKDRLEF